MNVPLGHAVVAKSSLTLMVVLVAVAAVACSPGGSGSSSSSGRSTAAPPAQQPAAVGAGVGQLAPDFQVKTLDGLMLTSADLLAQQKPYILYFFASW